MAKYDKISPETQQEAMKIAPFCKLCGRSSKSGS